MALFDMNAAAEAHAIRQKRQWELAFYANGDTLHPIERLVYAESKNAANKIGRTMARQEEMRFFYIEEAKVDLTELPKGTLDRFQAEPMETLFDEANTDNEIDYIEHQPQAEYVSPSDPRMQGRFKDQQYIPLFDSMKQGAPALTADDWQEIYRALLVQEHSLLSYKSRAVNIKLSRADCRNMRERSDHVRDVMSKIGLDGANMVSE